MNSLYDIREDDPNLLIDDIGIIKDGCDPCVMDGSLILDLCDSDGKKRVEYRRHQRFFLDKDAFALIHPPA